MNETKNTIYCSTHPDQQVVYLNSDLIAKESPFKCVYCVVDQDSTINTNSLVSLGQIMSHDQSMIVNNWPIIGDKSITKEMKNITTDLQQSTNNEEKIRKFFYSFREQILKKMDELECQFIEVESSLRKMRVDTLNAYNQLTSKQTIRDIIFSDHFKIEDKNEQITQIIQTIVSEQANIKKELAKSIEDINNKNLIDFKIMDCTLEKFIKNISSIEDFFNFNNTTQIEISKLKNSNQQQASVSQNESNSSNTEPPQLSPQKDNQQNQNLAFPIDANTNNKPNIVQPTQLSVEKIQNTASNGSLFDSQTNTQSIINQPLQLSGEKVQNTSASSNGDLFGSKPIVNKSMQLSGQTIQNTPSIGGSFSIKPINQPTQLSTEKIQNSPASGGLFGSKPIVNIPTLLSGEKVQNAAASGGLFGNNTSAKPIITQSTQLPEETVQNTSASTSGGLFGSNPFIKQTTQIFGQSIQNVPGSGRLFGNNPVNYPTQLSRLSFSKDQ